MGCQGRGVSTRSPTNTMKVYKMGKSCDNICFDINDFKLRLQRRRSR